MKVTANPKFHLSSLPKNDSELRELMEYQNQFSSRFNCREMGTSNKAFQSYRDWICYAFLGMTSGGYQQLKSIWMKEREEAEHAQREIQSLVDSFEKELNDLPNTIYIKDGIEEYGYNFISQLENAVEVSDKYRNSIDENDDFENRLDGDLEVAILEKFEVVEMFIEFPDADKHGYPENSSREGALKHICESYTDSVNKEKFDVVAIDRGDDGWTSVWYKLERK